MMTDTLALLLGLGISAFAVEADVTENAELRQCREWIESRSIPPKPKTALTRIVSSRTLCFDGDVYPWTVKEAVAWADRIEAEGGKRPRLVVRSAGGDASTAIDLAERLQRSDAEVTVVDYCMSSCANYFFAGVRRRYVVSGALILFHGGYSAEERPGFAKFLDQAVRDSKLAAQIGDPAKWHAERLKNYDRNLARQNALYRQIGVDPLVVTGMASIDADSIPASGCGSREGAARSVLFFDSEQLRRLGIVIAQGKPSTDPAEIDRRLSQFGFANTACAVPATFFSSKSLKERPSQ